MEARSRERGDGALMPTAPIIFGDVQESGDQQLAGASPLAVNVLTDGKGAVRRRPGISAWSGFPSTAPEATDIEGIHAFEGDIYYVTDTRKVYKIDPSLAVSTALSTAALSTRLSGSGRPTFAASKFRLVIAGGLEPQKVEPGATAAARLGGSPPYSNQVAALSARLFSDDRTSSATIGQIRFSETGTAGEETWDALNYAEAEGRPDGVITLRENGNELWAFGDNTLQIFSADPVAVIAPGRTQNIGCAAASSVILFDESFAWLDNHRRFVVSDGRGYQEISAPIAGTIDAIATASDCFGFRVDIDQFDCLVWVFPTDGRAFCYAGGGWSQWQGWTNNQGYTTFPAKSHYFFDASNLHLVGLASGKIAKIDVGATDDMGDLLKAEVRTGFVNRGTDAWKDCHAVRLICKRGATAITAPIMRLSWRDDLGDFCSPINVSLGTSGQYVHTEELRGLGTYRSRQWKVEMTDAADWILARVEEDYAISEGN